MEDHLNDLALGPEAGAGEELEPFESHEAVELESETLPKGRRRITARIQIPQTCEPVWQVLTDYEGLAGFIPNLTCSRRINHPENRIRIEQVGTQRFLRLKFSARVVLDMEEVYPEEIRFQMVEGDFRDFSGCWRLHPDNSWGTHLEYTLNVWPPRTMPVGLIERYLKRDLSANLLAIREQVQSRFG